MLVTVVVHGAEGPECMTDGVYAMAFVDPRDPRDGTCRGD